jgi:hypothetical protein
MHARSIFAGPAEHPEGICAVYSGRVSGQDLRTAE